MPLKTRSQRKSPGRNYSPSAESNAAAVPADKEEEETHAEASVGSLKGNEDSIKTRQDSCETERFGSPELGVSVPMSETEISIKRKENVKENENDTSEESFQPPAPSKSGNKERVSLSPTKQLSREITPSLQTGSTNDKVAADNIFSPRKSTQSQSVRSIDRSPRARSPWQSHSGSSQERLQQRPSPNNHRHGGAHQRVTEQLEAQTTVRNYSIVTPLEWHTCMFVWIARNWLCTCFVIATRCVFFCGGIVDFMVKRMKSGRDLLIFPGLK